VAVLPGSDIIALKEVIVAGIPRASVEEIAEAADFLGALLTPEQRLSHFDHWFAAHIRPLVHRPQGHPGNPIVLSDNGSSDSGYDNMPDLEYPLSPLYIPRSPDA
jgi:hypothetical protein